jgi:hypothetical protein
MNPDAPKLPVPARRDGTRAGAESTPTFKSPVKQKNHKTKKPHGCNYSKSGQGLHGDRGKSEPYGNAMPWGRRIVPPPGAGEFAGSTGRRRLARTTGTRRPPGRPILSPGDQAACPDGAERRLSRRGPGGSPCLRVLPGQPGCPALPRGTRGGVSAKTANTLALFCRYYRN